MKQHNVEREVGTKKYARITDDGVYEKYGPRLARCCGRTKIFKLIGSRCTKAAA